MNLEYRWLLGLCAAMCLLPSLYTLADVPHYTVVELMPPVDGKSVRGNALNNRGQVVGEWFTQEKGEWFAHGFLWANGQMEDLGTFNAKAINDQGQIVGDSQQHTRPGIKQAALLWQNGQFAPLDTFSDSVVDFAFAINVNGEVMGWSERGQAGTPTFLWQRGQARDINTTPTEPQLPPGASTWYEYQSPYRLNDRGQVAGNLRFEGKSKPLPKNVFDHACIWEKGHLQDLGALPEYPQSKAEAINNRGEVVGATYSPGDGAYNMGSLGHAFLWSHGHMQDLGTLPGDQVSAATCLNDRGQVVGYSAEYANMMATRVRGQRAVLWQQGRIVDLNRVLPQTSGFILTEAVGINRHGQILCRGKRTDGTESSSLHTFLLTP